MKRILLSVGIVFSLNAASSQTLPFKDFYFASPMLINPAMAGDRIDPTFTLISNIPTSGIYGAPASVSFSYDQQLKKINSGIGAVVSRENQGVHTEWRHTLMYNYRWKFSGSNELALGGSIFNVDLESDWDKLNSSGVDPYLTGQSRLNYFNFDVGASYSFFKGTNVGLSLISYPRIYRENFFFDMYKVRDQRRVVAFLEQDLTLNKWLKLRPSVLYTLPGELPAILNLNATAYISKWAFVGAQYSNNNSLNNTSNVFAGLCYNDAIQIGVKVFKKQTQMLAYGYRSAAFMLQVSPKRKDESKD
ncbi:PorP/SprF family type IX secretion system membrane protein [Imperialibacter roseus]|uniref:PorP/SprF family type IX secretion system membrane protein n=1 Tax=Imperialibacter roseus TaxID=1324217 RepID=A0ABZ0IUZ9_9BACT|nr:PorP/SprF family type IX secretion system membrane protein [Imperialibacter roseus]WOK08883.1 PorP/SprF family type IX secretion system membrane protein [Imperialibacter roseus]